MRSSSLSCRPGWLLPEPLDRRLLLTSTAIVDHAHLIITGDEGANTIDVAFDLARDEIIVTFLALLELIRLRAVRAGQAERFGQITVSLATANLGEAVELARQLTDTYVWGRSGEDDERQRTGNH